MSSRAERSHHWDAYEWSFPPSCKERLVAVLQIEPRGYFDASKINHSGKVIMSVAGYIWRYTDWKRSQKLWRRVLRDNDLEMFHMTDFESYYGPYKKWDRRRHEAVIRKLTGIIVQTALVGVGVGLVKTDYDRLDAEEKRIIDTPYGLCGAWCMALAARWLETQGIKEPVAYIFELGDEHQAPLRRDVTTLAGSQIFRDTIRVLSLNFEDKKNVPSLQAADIIAYELAKHMPRKLGIESRSIRKSLVSLLSGVPHESVYFDEPALRRLVAINKKPGNYVQKLIDGVKQELRKQGYKTT